MTEPLKVEIPAQTLLAPVQPVQPPLAPTTTAQQDITTDRQSRINLIWEVTQAIVAVAVTLAMLWIAIHGTTSETLTNAFFLIIGFYFSRTNHAAIGGIGPKPVETYQGR